MILDMRTDYENEDAQEATIVLNASLYNIVDVLELENAKIVAFDSFAKERVCIQGEMENFLNELDTYCPKLELFDLSKACPPDADLDSDEAKKFHQFVKFIKENTDIDIVATPELEKRFPILLQKNEEPDKLLSPYSIPLTEEKYSALQAVTKLQLAQIEKNLSPELCRDILAHSNNSVITQEVISAIDTQLNEETGQLNQYIPALLGCMAERYIEPENFDAIIDIAEKHIPRENITTEDINFCFGLQKESSQSEESSQRINSLIKELIPHLPEDVRQKLDEEAALKEKQQQEYLQKRQSLQAKVNEYRNYLPISDAIFNYEDVTSEDIRKIADTISDGITKYPQAYKTILDKISDEGDEYKIKAASHWIEPLISRINSKGMSDNEKFLMDHLLDVVIKNQDVRHEYGHIFCEQLKRGNDFWDEGILRLLEDNKDDHILLMNTYEDLEQAYKVRPDLISKSLDIFENSLEYPDIEKGFNDHLHTLASIVGDTAKEHPEFTDTAMRILSELLNIEKKLENSSSQSYLRSKIDEAFEKIKQNETATDTKLNLIVLHEKDPEIFASTVKELMNNPQTDQHIGNVIALRLNSGLDTFINDYDSAEGLKWNLAVLQSEALQKKGPDEISAYAEQIFKNGVLKQLEKNPDYNPSETLKVICDVAPDVFSQLREKLSDEQDLLMLQHFDRIPKDIQKLYIGENPAKIDNLIATDNLKNFPEIAAQKLKSEVCDYLSDISDDHKFENKRSRSGMEKWAAVLKEIGGYSSPEVSAIAINEAMRIRRSIAFPDNSHVCRFACQHFYETGEDIKQLVKISNDIIDNVFEQIRLQKDNQLFTDTFKKADYDGLHGKIYFEGFMGETASKAFLSGDENYKNLWDQKMAKECMNAYLMFKKPYEILQNTPLLHKRLEILNAVSLNTYVNGYVKRWQWKDFPELLTPEYLWKCIRDSSDKTIDDNVIKAVKTFCKARIDDTTKSYTYDILAPLMLAYEAEFREGIEDKEIFSILYRARFSKNSKQVREDMNDIYSFQQMTAPKLKSLCETSYLINKWILKSSTNEK